jgi:putative PIN family toxin of toxin-antitoxin system
VRAVVDPNVLVSALISSGGPPRQIVAAWVDERFELIASPTLLDELRDVLARTKFRRWVSAEVAADFVEGLKDAATLIDDPPPQPGTSPDPDDDYLIALARTGAADCLVSGDRHLTGLDLTDPPVLTPRQFLDELPDAST